MLLLPIKIELSYGKCSCALQDAESPPSDSKYPLTLTSLSGAPSCLTCASWRLQSWPWLSFPGPPESAARTFQASAYQTIWSFLQCTGLWIKYDSFLLCFARGPPGVWDVYVSAESQWFSSSWWKNAMAKTTGGGAMKASQIFISGWWQKFLWSIWNSCLNLNWRFRQQIHACAASVDE